MCNANGAWTGLTPQCKPVACGDPVTFNHASVALLNGTTVWNAIAQYSCIHGYKNKHEGTVYIKINKSQQSNINDKY